MNSTSASNQERLKRLFITEHSDLNDEQSLTVMILFFKIINEHVLL